MSTKDLKAVVFCGTSISHDDARQILDVEYRPPVLRSDVDKAVKQGFDVIGIIDGTFFDRAAVAHREIIKALGSGVKVVGGCSMGALRASELDSYGMTGVGKVYQWYRDGVIEADDEVAVTTNPETFEPVSAPLVNMRETFNSARDAGIVDEDVCDSLISLAKGTHYSRRSYLGVIKQAVMDGLISKGCGDKLFEYCRENEADVKRADAILVLETIRQILEE